MSTRKKMKITKPVLFAIIVITLIALFTFNSLAASAERKDYTIVFMPDGSTASNDPNVVKVDDLPDELFASANGNSFQSASSSASRAVTTVNAGSYTVSEHYEIYIEPPTLSAGETLAWSTTSPYHASIGGDGNVTMYTAGAVEVYITVTHTNGNQTKYVYKILITLADGVYKIQNKSSGHYIELPAGNITEGTEYIQWTAENNRNSKFKITYIGDGLYTIRSMVVSSMGFKIGSGTINNSAPLTNAHIGYTDDTSVVNAAEFKILSDVNGYYIQEARYPSATYVLTVSSDDYGYDSKMMFSYPRSNDLQQRWNLLRQIGYSESGVDIRNTVDTLVVGEPWLFSATVYSSIIGENGGAVTWYSYNGTGSATINSSTGLITPTSPGTVLIRATYRLPNGQLWYSNHTITVTSTTSNTFFVVNYYDSTLENNTELISNISKAHLFANVVYRRFYDTRIAIDGSPSFHLNPITDECDLADNVQCNDDCGNICYKDHHKNITVIANWLHSRYREDNHIYTLWANRPNGSYCVASGETHQTFNGLGVVINTLCPQSVSILTVVGSDVEDRMYCMSVGFAHELSHIFEMDDYYDDFHKTLYSTDYGKCIMQEYNETSVEMLYNNVMSGYSEPFCEDCMPIILGLMQNASLDAGN